MSQIPLDTINITTSNTADVYTLIYNPITRVIDEKTSFLYDWYLENFRSCVICIYTHTHAQTYINNFFYYGYFTYCFYSSYRYTTNTRLLVTFANRIAVCGLFRLLSAYANRMCFIYFILSLKLIKRQYVTGIDVYCRNTG